MCKNKLMMKPGEMHVRNTQQLWPQASHVTLIFASYAVRIRIITRIRNVEPEVQFGSKYEYGGKPLTKERKLPLQNTVATHGALFLHYTE